MQIACRFTKKLKFYLQDLKKVKLNIIFMDLYLLKNLFSVGEWYKLVAKKLNKLKKEKVPIVVGGTGLYFRALTEGLVEIPKVEKRDFSHLNPMGRWMMGNHYYKKKSYYF